MPARQENPGGGDVDIDEYYVNELFKDRDPCRPRLDSHDIGWLSTLRGVYVDNVWLDTANEFLLNGVATRFKPKNRDMAERVMAARDEFYGSMIGLNEPGNPLAAAYQKLKTQGLPRTENFISIMRVLDGFKIDQAGVFKAFPRMAGLGAYSTLYKLEVLADAGLDPAVMVRRFPSLLGYAEKTLVAKIIYVIEQGLDPKQVFGRHPGVFGLDSQRIGKQAKRLRTAAGRLGWAGDTTEIMNTFPQFFDLGEAKLRTHFRLFSNHGTQDYSPKDVARLLVKPLESHLIVIADGKDYEPSTVSRISDDMKAPQRKEKVTALLSDPKARQLIGERVISAYQRYAA